MISLVTARLVLRRWIGGGLVRDEQQTKAAIEAFERRWGQHGLGMFDLELRASGGLFGFTGLAVPQFLPEVMPAAEIGGRLGRAFWGPRASHRSGSSGFRFGLIGRNLG